MLNALSRGAAALALLAGVPAAYAQAQAPAPTPAPAVKDVDPALWVVKDADTTIYLFGTIHILKPGLGWFDDGVKAAFDKSDQLVLEMVKPDDATMQQMVIRMAINPSGATITEQLPEDKRAAYAAALAEDGIPQAAIDHFDPWFAAVVLSVAPLPRLGYDPKSGVEDQLSAAASAVNKPVIGLETAEQQLGYFDTLPVPLQVKYLVSTIDELPKMAAELDSMVTSWSAGDPDSLAKTLNEGLRDSPEIAKVLLADRNARWAKWIEARLAQPGTVFVAVGAGHLAGADSVQAFLANDKVRAERVDY